MLEEAIFIYVTRLCSKVDYQGMTQDVFRSPVLLCVGGSEVEPP